MSISALFPGMEAYLDGDVEINNDISAPEEEVTAANQSAEIASDLADEQSENKNTEIATNTMLRMYKLYSHVKTYGIDRTFLSIYNANGELDRMCNMQFPSCESMNDVGSPYDQYSARFITAMEEAGETWWQLIKRKAREFWEWIKEKANKIWEAIKGFFDFLTKRWHRLVDYFKKNKNAGANDPDAKDCADDAKTAAVQMIETKENNDKAAEAASKAGEEVIKAAEEAAAAEDGSEEQKSAVEETKAKAEELNKQVQKIEAQAEQQRRNQEDLNKRMAELTEKNNKQRAEEQKKKEEEDAAAAEKERVNNIQQTGSGELAHQIMNYLRTRDAILNNSVGVSKYRNLSNEISEMLNIIEHHKNLGLTEDGQKIATVLLQAAGKLRNVQDLIASGIHRTEIVDKKLIERVEKILRTDKRVTEFTDKAKEVLRNSKESGISNKVKNLRDQTKDRDAFDRALQ